MRMLLHGATFIGIMAVLFLIQRHSTRRRPGDGCQSVFTYSWPVKLFGIAIVLILPLIIFDIAQSWYLRSCLFMVEAVLLYYVVVLLTTRVVLGPDSVQVSSVFRTVTLQLTHLSEISIDESAQCYLLWQEGKRPLKISFYISGANALIAAIEQRTGAKCRDRFG